MKRLVALLLAVSMLLALTACGGTPTEDNGGTTTEGTTTTTSATTTTTTTAGTAEAPTTTTTEASTTTAAPTTTTTEETTTTTEFDPVIRPEEPDNRPTIKILSIGHSFSVDAMKTYMWDLFDAAGYNATIGYLYYPSCSLGQHYHYITENRAAYEQYAKNSDGSWDYSGPYAARALDALWDEDWDIITFQPDPDFGYDKFLNNVSYKCESGCNATNDYAHFNDLVSYVLSLLASPNNPNGPNTDVKVYYHLTWSFSQDCWLGKYLYPAGYDQRVLYQDFIDATNKYILTNKTVLGVIPCGTAIENARTTYMGDTFNSDAKDDGYHLNDKGDFVAALTWVCYFTGVKAKDIDYLYGYRGTQYQAMAEAVDNAIAHPWEITESTYKTEE